MANDILPKDHGIVAADWQMEAADRLTAIVLPLADKIAKSGSDYHWMDGESYCVSPIKPDGSLDEIFKAGDRIFLEEEWSDLREYFPRADAFTLKSELKENCHNQAVFDALEIDSLWQPAHTMPPEAAQHWYEVTDVRVTQMDNISLKEMRDSSLFNPLTDDLFDFLGTVKERWNVAHPGHLWNSDRWVVVLEVEAP
jgi:hypothetical protein